MGNIGLALDVQPQGEGDLQILVPNGMDLDDMIFWTPTRRYCKEAANDFLKRVNLSGAGYISFVLDLMLAGF